ncbi:Translation factor guf1 mitochondrial [Gaertneriomyces sp. JEL0708]|nr:Translation factor guf1 mitochondrial [Gaertneriomyces sp. JEL0708]
MSKVHRNLRRTRFPSIPGAGQPCRLHTKPFCRPPSSQLSIPQANLGIIGQQCKHLPQRNSLPSCFGSLSPHHRGYASKPDILDISSFPPERIRNFSIIAHIDHGKSTLADRLLEMTGTISKDSQNKQFLDKLKVERERGITVKAQTASMFYTYNGEEYLLNLIDTPGHVDFSYEVSRSLAACQGTLLLVDACQGIQAQTVANFFLAFGEDLAIIPVVNKVDLPSADPARVANQIEAAFELETADILAVSAKTGLGCSDVLPCVIEKVPPPVADRSAPFRALLFDNWYDKYLGVVCLFAIRDGTLKKGDRLVSAHTKITYEVTDLGIMYPEQRTTTSLHAGQVGYAILGMKTTRDAHIGDTFYREGHPVESFPGFQPAKSMVFAGLYPVDSNDYTKLNDALDRLTLNDASVTVAKESSNALGQGFRLGFLGTLHMDVFRERLEEEYDASVINTNPTVPYLIQYHNGTEKTIRNPAEFPDIEEHPKIKAFLEPMVNGTLIFPAEYLGSMMDLCGSHRGEQQEYTYLDDTRVIMKYTLPLSEILTDFYDQLKSRSSGYASFDYEEIGYQKSDIVKVNILLNAKPVDALATIVHRSTAEKVAKEWTRRLKGVMSKQLFEIVIQASVNNKFVCRETISALRKDVTAKCYGGDITRKMKLLERQKAGKKKLKTVAGGIQLPQEAFLTLMKGEDAVKGKKGKD